jgi:hypothetical protein
MRILLPYRRHSKQHTPTTPNYVACVAPETLLFPQSMAATRHSFVGEAMRIANLRTSCPVGSLRSAPSLQPYSQCVISYDCQQTQFTHLPPPFQTHHTLPHHQTHPHIHMHAPADTRQALGSPARAEHGFLATYAQHAHSEDLQYLQHVGNQHDNSHKQSCKWRMLTA